MSGPHQTIPDYEFLYDYLVHWARETPDESALILDQRHFSYRALLTEVDACARSLLASGVRMGDRVATLAPPCPEYFVTFLAASTIGAIWLGLNPRYREKELRYVIDDAAPCILFARRACNDPDYAAGIESLEIAASSLKTIVDIDGGIDKAWLQTAVSDDEYQQARDAVGARDACVIVYTSGSTGSPKGALLCHEAITEFSRLQNVEWPVTRLRVLNYFPINHVGCLIDTSTPCLVAGGTMVFMEQFEPRGSLRLIEQERITLWGSVPSVFQMQLSLPEFVTFDLSSVELIVWEGAAMSPELIARLKTICSRMATNYGMTETTSAITIVKPTDDEEILANSVGAPLDGVLVRLVDEEGKVVEDMGEVQTRSRFNTIGYWNRADDTRDAFTEDGWFRTGDVAERRHDGNYRIVGRKKEMFKSGGYNVYPREIELALEEHPRIESAVVVSVPDPLWDEIGVAFVLAESTVTVEEIQAFCKGRLANYKTPKRIEMCTAFPLLPIGKIDRKALQATALGH